MPPPRRRSVAPATKPKPTAQAQKPLEVRQTNAEFLRRHPERGGRLPHPSAPADAKARAEYQAIYAQMKQRNAAQRPKATPAKPTLPCQAVKQACEMKSMEFNCEHHPAKRTYKVVLPNADSKKRLLEVIAGNSVTKETITVRWVVAKGLCNQRGHKARAVIIRRPHKAPDLMSASSPCKFDVKSSLVLPKASGIRGKLAVLYKHIWPSYQTKDVYLIIPQACNTNANWGAAVRVFPDLAWSVELGVTAGIEKERRRTPRFARGGSPSIENSDGFPISFEAKCSYSYDGATSDLSAEFKNTYLSSSTWMKGIKTSASWFRKIAYYAGNVKVTFPQISFGFKYASKLVEDSSRAIVARNVTLEVGGDPLIGAAAEVDLLELLINAAGKGGAGLGIVCAPAIADFLIRAKKAMEGGGSFLGVSGKAVFKLVLGIKGGIAAKGSIQIQLGKIIEATGTVEGKIEFSFGGQASVEGTAWMVTAVAGVSLQGSAGFAGGGQFGADGEGPYFGGKLYFSGAKLEFRKFFSVKVSRTPPSAPKESEGGSKNGWTVTWPAWPDEGEYKKRRFF